MTHGRVSDTFSPVLLLFIHFFFSLFLHWSIPSFSFSSVSFFSFFWLCSCVVTVGQLFHIHIVGNEVLCMVGHFWCPALSWCITFLQLPGIFQLGVFTLRSSSRRWSVCVFTQSPIQQFALEVSFWYWTSKWVLAHSALGSQLLVRHFKCTCLFCFSAQR